MKGNQKFKGLREDQSGYTQLVGAVVALLLTVIIGVMVFWQVNDSIILNNDDANESRDGVTSMASIVFGLLPIVALVMVAGIILAVVMGFGGGGNKV